MAEENIIQWDELDPDKRYYARIKNPNKGYEFKDLLISYDANRRTIPEPEGHNALNDPSLFYVGKFIQRIDLNMIFDRTRRMIVDKLPKNVYKYRNVIKNDSNIPKGLNDRLGLDPDYSPDKYYNILMFYVCGDDFQPVFAIHPDELEFIEQKRKGACTVSGGKRKSKRRRNNKRKSVRRKKYIC